MVPLWFSPPSITFTCNIFQTPLCEKKKRVINHKKQFAFVIFFLVILWTFPTPWFFLTRNRTPPYHPKQRNEFFFVLFRYAPHLTLLHHIDKRTGRKKTFQLVHVRRVGFFWRTAVGNSIDVNDQSAPVIRRHFGLNQKLLVMWRNFPLQIPMADSSCSDLGFHLIISCPVPPNQFIRFSKNI